jgi:hypothetical protein
MTRIDFAILRDRTIDWLFTHAPALCQDDVLLEGFLHFVCKEVLRGVTEERKQWRDRIKHTSTC